MTSSLYPGGAEDCSQSFGGQGGHAVADGRAVGVGEGAVGRLERGPVGQVAVAWGRQRPLVGVEQGEAGQQLAPGLAQDLLEVAGGHAGGTRKATSKAGSGYGDGVVAGRIRGTASSSGPSSSSTANEAAGSSRAAATRGWSWPSTPTGASPNCTAAQRPGWYGIGSAGW